MASITQTSNTVLFTAKAPTTQKRRMTGKSTPCGTARRWREAMIAHSPSGTMRRLAKTKTRKTACTRSASMTKTIGPGVMPFIRRTPMRIAVIVSPGIPKTSAGT